MKDEEPDENDDETTFTADDKRADASDDGSVVSKSANRCRLVYGVEDRPAFHLSALFGLQHLLLAITGSISVPIIVANLICAEDLPLVRAYIIGAFLVKCGVSTILQCIVGVRLPIVQGGSSTFITPIMAMMSLDRWRCRAGDLNGTGISLVNFTDMNVTDFAIDTNETLVMDSEYWKIPMRELQGSIMLASLTQVIIGGFGLGGLITRFVGPLTVAPTVALIGLSLTNICVELCAKQWGIAMLSLVLLFLFTLYLTNVTVPIPNYNKITHCHFVKAPIFKLLPLILTIGIAWAFCAILEVCGLLGEEPGSMGYGARTNLTTVREAAWFSIPCPLLWGAPTVSLASYVGMLCITLSSVVESIGDYYTCARTCGVASPPEHAINRGIMVEGLGSVFAGAIGSGGASTSYSGNIGAIGITSVGSRVVFVCTGVLFILCGVFGKFGALLSAMPEPILGATVTVGLAVVVSVAFANLSMVDMDSSRNQCILGVSLLLGLMIPSWTLRNQIKTGFAELDEALSLVLGTPVIVGGTLGCFLDNTVPGTDAERGIDTWRKQMKAAETDQPITAVHVTYDIPYISGFLKRFPRLSKLPFVQSVISNSQQ